MKPFKTAVAGVVLFAAFALFVPGAFAAVTGTVSRWVGNLLVFDGTTGNNAFAFDVDGLRGDFGTGANDYLTSNGTAVSTPGGFTAASLDSNGTNTLSGATPLNLTASTGGLFCNNASSRCIIESAISSTSAGATAATAMHQIFPDNALDPTDWVISVATQANAVSLFNVTYSSGTQTAYGTGATLAPVVGTLAIVSTAVGNVGASGPDDLQTYTMPANTLTVTNRGIRITARGICANNVNAKTFTVNFGSQVVLTHACTVSVAGESWKIETTIVRTGASTQDWESTYYGSTGAAGAFEFDPENGTATQTESGAIVIKMQSTASTTTDDIVQELMIVEAI